MNLMENTPGKGTNVSAAVGSGKGRAINPQLYQSPFYVLIIVASSILVAEAIAIGFVHYLSPTLPPLAEEIIDVLLETILISPVLYFFLFRPLLLHIAERKKAEQALRESEEKLHLLFQNANDSIFIIDPSTHRFLEVNENAAKRLGYTKDELLQLTIDDIDTPMAASRNEAIIQELQEKGSVLFEHAHQRKDGTEMPIEISSKIIEYGGRKVFQSFVRDITERKHAEQERERLNAELAEKNKELEQMIHVVSHDLRSPLVNIQGFSAELERGLKDIRSALLGEGASAETRNQLLETLQKDIPEALDCILSSTSKMDSLLHSLLRLSQLGRAPLKIEALDMNKTMTEIVKGLEFQAKEVGASVEIEELPSCRGDRGQINQVFSNLLDNALKYLSPDRTGRIKISGKKQRQQCVYCIEDNGIGIPKESCESIYDIFQQLDSSESKGEGLGLTIVRRILSRHGGKVWVQSEPGKGSKFYVSIPR